jgi:hypothetical protein
LAVLHAHQHDELPQLNPSKEGGIVTLWKYAKQLYCSSSTSNDPSPRSKVSSVTTISTATYTTAGVPGIQDRRGSRTATLLASRPSCVRYPSDPIPPWQTMQVWGAIRYGKNLPLVRCKLAPARQVKKSKVKAETITCAVYSAHILWGPLLLYVNQAKEEY